MLAAPAAQPWHEGVGAQLLLVLTIELTSKHQGVPEAGVFQAEAVIQPAVQPMVQQYQLPLAPRLGAAARLARLGGVSVGQKLSAGSAMKHVPTALVAAVRV